VVDLPRTALQSPDHPAFQNPSLPQVKRILGQSAAADLYVRVLGTAPPMGARSEDTTRSMLARRTANWFRWERCEIVFVVKESNATPHDPRAS
jgi:hypothetical protein